MSLLAAPPSQSSIYDDFAPQIAAALTQRLAPGLRLTAAAHARYVQAPISELLDEFPHEVVQAALQLTVEREVAADRANGLRWVAYTRYFCRLWTDRLAR